MKSIRLILAGLFFLFLAACSNEDELTEIQSGSSAGGEINFQIGFENEVKVSTDANFKSKFEEGDQIGLFIVKSGESIKPSGNYEDNRKLTYNSGIWTLEGDKIYAPVDGSSLSYYAYYPYVAGTDPTTMIFGVKNDQSQDGMYDISDLLLSKAENQTKATVSLQFAHALSLIQIEVVKGANMVSFDSTLKAILHNTQTSANVDLVNGSATSINTTLQDIVMSRVETESGYIYRALVPAQTIAANTELFTFVQETTGKEIDNSYTTEVETVLTGGKVTKWRITLEGEALPEHNYSVGDVYPFMGTPLGIVFEVSNGGKNGKIVSLMEKQHRWGTSPKDEFADGVDFVRDADNGKGATQSIVNARKDASNFATDYVIFPWLYTIMNENDANGQWYISSKNELKSLYAAMSGLTYDDVSTSWIDGASMPNFNAAEAIAARTAFNENIKAVGGAEFNLNGQYWTSTEIDNQKAWSVHFGTGILQNSKFKYDEWGRARGVMEF